MDLIDNSILDESLLNKRSCMDNQTSDNDIINFNNDLKCHNHLLDRNEKRHAIWTKTATLSLLKLYEEHIGILETPKKKTAMWQTIAEKLKTYDIKVSADQVRWKINALTKRYRQCIENRYYKSFKYFKEIDKIFGKYNDEHETCSVNELLHRKIYDYKNKTCNALYKMIPESKAMIEFRKIRLANRIESDRCLGKIKLERQWIDYLQKQEEQKLLRDEVYERRLQLKQEELDLRKSELQMKEALELQTVELKEKEQDELLQIEREKCELLKQMVYHHLSRDKQQSSTYNIFSL